MITETKTRRVEQDITVIEISGRLNLGNSLVAIETEIKRLIDRGARKLVIDLTAVNFIDSSGIGMLVSCAGQMEESQGHIRIAGAQGSVAKAFRIVHLDRIAPLDENVESACRNLLGFAAAE